MELTQQQKNLLNNGKIIALATSGIDAVPRVIFVEASFADKDEILITDNYMGITRKNIIENKNVSVLAFKEDYSYCITVSGEAEYYPEGKYFDFIKNLERNKNFSPKGAVVVKIKEISESK